MPSAEREPDRILADILPELARKDLSIVNLEAPFVLKGVPIEKSGPNLKLHPERLGLVQHGRWDVACCANNHIGDFGPGAVRDTLGMLQRGGILPLGAGEDIESAEAPVWLERGGYRIALLAFAENEFGMATASRAGANPLHPVRNIGHIRAAARQADLVLVMIHGGNEYNPVPSPRMVHLCRAFAEAGAATVVGGHTHCPQGIEWWQGVPIVYSLGNFYFPKIFSAQAGYNWWHGYSVRIGFEGCFAQTVEVIPHHFLPPDMTVRRHHGHEKQRFLDYLSHLSGIAGDLRMVEGFFDAWCMRDMESGYFPILGTPFLPVDGNDPVSVQRLAAMRNLHTCEAHCELITHCLEILCERREVEAAGFRAQLDALCAGQIPSTFAPSPDTPAQPDASANGC